MLTGMVTFEGGQGITFSKEMIVEFDSLGFNCYSTSRAGLFKWNGLTDLPAEGYS